MANCPICRDLQPVDCPGCGTRPDAKCYTLPNGDCVSDGPCMHTPVVERPVTNVNRDDVEHEIFRGIGEPFVGFREMEGRVYPSVKETYYPGCNEG